MKPNVELAKTLYNKAGVRGANAQKSACSPFRNKKHPQGIVGPSFSYRMRSRNEVPRVLCSRSCHARRTCQPASAQDSPQPGRSGASVKNSRIARPAPDDLNAWTVGLAGGLLEGAFIRYAADLAKVLDDGDNLRVIPMVTFGARLPWPVRVPWRSSERRVAGRDRQGRDPGRARSWYWRDANHGRRVSGRAIGAGAPGWTARQGTQGGRSDPEQSK